jgi:hypothetical protein
MTTCLLSQPLMSYSDKIVTYLLLLLVILSNLDTSATKAAAQAP